MPPWVRWRGSGAPSTAPRRTRAWCPAATTPLRRNFAGPSRSAAEAQRPWRCFTLLLHFMRTHSINHKLLGSLTLRIRPRLQALTQPYTPSAWKTLGVALLLRESTRRSGLGPCNEFAASQIHWPPFGPDELLATILFDRVGNNSGPLKRLISPRFI